MDGPNECEACNCFNHSRECHYDEEVDKKRQSLNINGDYDGGGVCDNCLHNTEGINCDKCRSGYYRPRGRPLNAFDACVPCQVTYKLFHLLRAIIHFLWSLFSAILTFQLETALKDLESVNANHNFFLPIVSSAILVTLGIHGAKNAPVLSTAQSTTCASPLTETALVNRSIQESIVSNVPKDSMDFHSARTANAIHKTHWPRNATRKLGNVRAEIPTEGENVINAMLVFTITRNVITVSAIELVARLKFVLTQQDDVSAKKDMTELVAIVARKVILVIPIAPNANAIQQDRSTKFAITVDAVDAVKTMAG